MTSRTITIINPSGLHARPASEFVAEAKKFGSSITIRDLSDENGEAVNAKSIVMLLTLGIGPGTKVEITAEGPDEAEAVGSLFRLSNRLGTSGQRILVPPPGGLRFDGVHLKTKVSAFEEPPAGIDRTTWR